MTTTRLSATTKGTQSPTHSKSARATCAPNDGAARLGEGARAAPTGVVFVNDSESPPPSGADEAKPFLPHNWQELAPLVDTVLDAPAARRAQVLDEVTGGDPQRYAALEWLVAECERDVPLFNRPAAERFARLVSL